MTKKLKINKNTQKQVEAQQPKGPMKQAYRFSALSMTDFTTGPLDLEALSNDPRAIGCRVELIPENGKDDKLVIMIRSMHGAGIKALPLVVTGELANKLVLESAGEVDEHMPNLWDYVYLAPNGLAEGRIHLKDFPEVYLEFGDGYIKGASTTLEITKTSLKLSDASLKDERESLERYKEFGLLVKKQARTKKEGEESYAGILRYVVKKLAKLNNYHYPIDSDNY